MNLPPWSENQEFVNELTPLLSETEGEKSNLMLNKPPKNAFRGLLFWKADRLKMRSFHRTWTLTYLQYLLQSSLPFCHTPDRAEIKLQQKP